MRFEHIIVYPTTTKTETVYFLISDDGLKARFIEGEPSTHPNGIWLGADIDRIILAEDALGFKIDDNGWYPLEEITAPLERKGIAFRFVPASDEEAASRREIFDIRILRKTAPRNKKINRRGHELAERLPALMEGRASQYGIVRHFESLGIGWRFKPTGYAGPYWGSFGPDRAIGEDDSLPTKEEAFAALERYGTGKTTNTEEAKQRNPVLFVLIYPSQ